MKINVAMGFFLPVPPLAGGATEKSWHGLAREFAARGHSVTVLSRHWPGLPAAEQAGGVNHVRLRGHAHTANLGRNLWLDLLWSWRVWRRLPRADVTVAHCVALPVWLGSFPRGAGRVVVQPGRIPKGQFRLYRKLDRILAVSSVVRDAVLAENPHWARALRVVGYPINYGLLAQSRATPPAGEPLTIGYVGRLHREKGLELLIDAACRLAGRSDLPDWRLLLCGPREIAKGGSGPEFTQALETRLAAHVSPDRFAVREPEFTEERLAAVYREFDIFCYPSLAARGETFGVAVLEAMAAGAAPVVSSLPSFDDFIRSGENGVRFAHAGPGAADRLAGELAGLLVDAPRRRRFATAAQTIAANYAFPAMADRLLADFSTLLPAPGRQI